MKREFLQLAHTYKNEGIGGYLVSEKLDGMRAFWDAGISRGLWKYEVPYANTLKDERYLQKQKATGLWSRYGNVIHAPDWFLDKLPHIPLDGEIYAEGYRQDLMSIIKKLEAGSGWEAVQYNVFDVPPMTRVFEAGKINNINFKKTIASTCLDWVSLHSERLVWTPGYWTGFTTRLAGLRNRATANDVWKIHEQTELPMQTEAATAQLERMLADVLARGGEGLIVRSPHAPYECGRVHSMLKVKGCSDMEGTVIGYTAGREGKLLGLMGALVIRLDNGIELELSGFTDEERVLSSTPFIDASSWVIGNPGRRCPDTIWAQHFPRGTRVTFTYRGLSKDGVPQEARYWRKHVG